MSARANPPTRSVAWQLVLLAWACGTFAFGGAAVALSERAPVTPTVSIEPEAPASPASRPVSSGPNPSGTDLDTDGISARDWDALHRSTSRR